MTAYYDIIKRGTVIPNGIYSNRHIEKFITQNPHSAVGIAFGHSELIKKAIKIGMRLKLEKLNKNSKGIYPVSFQEPSAINKIYCNYFLNVCISELAKEKILNHDLKLIIYLEQEPVSEKQFFVLFDCLQKSDFNNFLIYSTFLPKKYENDDILKKHVKPSYRGEVEWFTREDYLNLVPEILDKNFYTHPNNSHHDKLTHKNIKSVVFNHTCNNYDFRVATAYYLLKNNLSEVCAISYNTSYPILKNFTSKSPKIQEFIQSPDIKKSLESTYGYLSRSDLKKGDIHLALEAYFSNDLVSYPYVTEKSIRSITLKKPFLVVGQKGTLNEIRRKGYKTFHPIIDESYDLIDDNDERFFSVLQQFSNIIRLPEKEYIKFLSKLEDTVSYNYEIFKKKFYSEIDWYL